MDQALLAARKRSDYPSAGSDPFIPNKDEGQRGIEIPFDPSRFVTEVVIGPREQPSIEGLVKSVFDRYGFKINVTVSDRLKPRL